MARPDRLTKWDPAGKNGKLFRTTVECGAPAAYPTSVGQAKPESRNCLRYELHR